MSYADISTDLMNPPGRSPGGKLNMLAPANYASFWQDMMSYDIHTVSNHGATLLWSLDPVGVGQIGTAVGTITGRITDVESTAGAAMVFLVRLSADASGSIRHIWTNDPRIVAYLVCVTTLPKTVLEADLAFLEQVPFSTPGAVGTESGMYSIVASEPSANPSQIVAAETAYDAYVKKAAGTGPGPIVPVKPRVVTPQVTPKAPAVQPAAASAAVGGNMIVIGLAVVTWLWLSMRKK